MIIFVGLLIIVGGITYPLHSTSRVKAEQLVTLAEARSSGVIVANAIQNLYTSGIGSKQTVEYWLPKGVAEFRINPGSDGIAASDASVLPNGRMDVGILLDFDGDGVWDNERDTTVLIETLLPSQWYDNGDSRDNAWVRENAVQIHDENFKLNPLYRCKHRTTFEFYYGPGIPMMLENWDLSQVEERKLKTTLFGEEVEVEAENEGATIEAKLEVGDEKDSGSGVNFTLSKTSNGVTVTVDVIAPTVSIRYVPPSGTYKQILVEDEVLEYA